MTTRRVLYFFVPRLDLDCRLRSRRCERRAVAVVGPIVAREDVEAGVAVSAQCLLGVSPRALVHDRVERAIPLAGDRDARWRGPLLFARARPLLLPYLAIAQSDFGAACSARCEREHMDGNPRAVWA